MAYSGMKKLRRSALLATAPLALLCGSEAWAQAGAAENTSDTADDSAEADSGAMIVVTARKREESLQDTPIAISAFTGENLEARGLQRANDLASFTPNLTFQNSPGHSGSSAAAAVYIRGVGQQDFVPTVEPGVGIYVDGVYVARSVGAVLDILDVERIEVLRLLSLPLRRGPPPEAQACYQRLDHGVSPPAPTAIDADGNALHPEDTDHPNQ